MKVAALVKFVVRFSIVFALLVPNSAAVQTSPAFVMCGRPFKYMERQLARHPGPDGVPMQFVWFVTPPPAAPRLRVGHEDIAIALESALGLWADSCRSARYPRDKVVLTHRHHLSASEGVIVLKYVDRAALLNARQPKSLGLFVPYPPNSSAPMFIGGEVFVSYEPLSSDSAEIWMHRRAFDSRKYCISRILAHEAGHTLGVGHNLSTDGDLMDEELLPGNSHGDAPRACECDGLSKAAELPAGYTGPKPPRTGTRRR